MKITEPFGQQPTNPGMRKRRMEALLSAWRQQPLWLPADALTFAAAPPDSTKLEPVESQAWNEIIRDGDPIPPRTAVRGLEAHARVRGMRIEALAREKTVSVIGRRVATRWRSGGAGLGGHSWSVRVPIHDRPDADELREAVLRKRFREVTRHDAALTAAEPYGDYLDTLPLLLVGVTADRGELSRLWMLARALHLDEAFLRQLVPEAKRILAEVLGTELVEAAVDLDVRTDARLVLFAEGHSAEVPDHFFPPLPLPRSRVADLIASEQWLDHAHSEIADHYYEDLARAYVLVADVFPLGEMLKRLPPGRAFFAAIERICSHRPELIATFVWHPAFHAEGAFALLRLPAQRHLPEHVLDLTDEWLEVERLGRESLILADRAEDWHSIVALGIHDESEMLACSHYGSRPTLLQKGSREDAPTWTAAVSSAERAKAIIDVLDDYFHDRTRRDDAATLFALRLLAPLQRGGLTELANRIARAVVDGYAAALTLDHEVLSIPDALCAYGPLLRDLGIALRGSGNADERWATWLRPFDARAYIELARADAGMSVDSSRVNPAYDVARIFRAHAETLTAQASATIDIDEQQCRESLDAAIDLYLLNCEAGRGIDAFSWHALARTFRLVAGCEPLFVTMGRLIERLAEGSDRLERLVAAQPQAHILAYLLLGLDSDGSRSDRVRIPLRAAINDLLSSGTGLALGHALELANVLHQAAMGRDAERLARRVLEIAEQLRPHERASYSDAALAILAGALAQQELWAELLSLAPEVRGEAQHRFVENMRALALMANGKLTEAQETLERVLAASPADPTALANIVVLHLRGGEWDAAIQAAVHAKRLLPSSQWDSILVNEALAREQLGDKHTAETLIQGLSTQALARAGVRDVVKRLKSGVPSDARTGVPPSADPPPQDATRVPDSPLTNAPLPAPPGPSDSVDVAIVTALQVEYEAVRDRLTNWAPAPPHPQFTNLFCWVTGTMPRSDGTGSYRVVVALAGASGNLRTEYVTMRTIDRWRPRYLLFSGIAGGLLRTPDDKLKHGDVVVSETIWHYEYQKIVDGRHVPRGRDTFPADVGLVNAARAFGSSSSEWRNCGVAPPTTKHVPKAVLGVIGSGEKVIDDLDLPFVQAVRSFMPEVQAVEMEAAGACMAIQFAHAENKGVGFLMVRGISDMPKESAAPLKQAVRALFKGRFRAILGSSLNAGGDGSGTAIRDNWKPYGSAIAAHFVTTLIASGWWPEPPRSAKPAQRL